MFLVNITSFMDWFVSLMTLGITNTFTLLDSITFHGVSYLDFSLALILIGVGITIVIAINKSSSSLARSTLSGRSPKSSKSNGKEK